MSESQARRRVIRLLTGEYRPDDFMQLFLFARDRSDGRESVQEIGDFCAHHGERTKGLITRRVRLQYASVLFATKYQYATLPLNDIDSALSSYILHNATNMSSDDLRKKRVDRKEIFKLAQFISKYASTNSNGSLSLIKNSRCILNRDQMHVFKMVTDAHVIAPSLLGAGVAAEFFEVLRSNSLISKEEIRQAGNLVAVVQLFCLSVVHRAKIVLSGQEPVEIMVAEDTQDPGTLDANMFAKTSPLATFVTPIMTTKLRSDDHCASELLRHGNYGDVWLEVKPNGRLGII